MTTPAPAEAVLIRRAREACGYSPEAAAARCGKRMTGRRWRQIEAGEETSGGKAVRADDGRLAHMAHAVAVTPEELRTAGRDEAAEVLAVIRTRETATVDELLGRLAGPAGDDLGEELDDLRQRVERSSAALDGRELRLIMTIVERLARRER